MATVQQVRDLRAEGAPADLSPDSDMESPSMKQARELGYTASAFPDEAASPLPDIEPVFGRPRTPQPYDYTPPPNLLEALRGALPYWGQGAEDVESNAKSDVQNASDEEVNRVDPETGDTPLLLSAQYGAGDLVEMLVERGADVDITLPSGATTAICLHIFSIATLGSARKYYASCKSADMPLAQATVMSQGLPCSESSSKGASRLPHGTLPDELRTVALGLAPRRRPRAHLRRPGALSEN